jgi:hypothetical protein
LLKVDFIHVVQFQGDYEGKALFYGKSNPDNILGCVNMAFSIAAGKGHDEL